MRLIALLFIVVTGLSACKKKNPVPEYGTYELRLIDSPGLYDNVYLDIQEVAIMVDGQGWLTIGPVTPGVCDLLAYNNGVDMLLATNSEVPVGSISQIRLILGPNNSVVKNGVSHTLVVPSSSQSGIKISISSNITADNKLVEWLDIDAGSSISELPNGTFKLQPVMRTFKESVNGRFKGYVLPVESYAHVEAIMNDDTIIAIPEDDGFYQFSGLQGNYKLRFVPGIGTYNTVELDNNGVSGNQQITIQSVTL